MTWVPQGPLRLAHPKMCPSTLLPFHPSWSQYGRRHSVAHLAVILPISGSWLAARQEQTTCFSVNPQCSSNSTRRPQLRGIGQGHPAWLCSREAPTMPWLPPGPATRPDTRRGRGRVCVTGDPGFQSHGLRLTPGSAETRGRTSSSFRRKMVSGD